MKRIIKWIIYFISSAIGALPNSYLFAAFCVGDGAPEFSKWFWITYIITIPIFYVILVANGENYKTTAKDVTTSYHKGSLFNLDVSKDKHDIEDFRSVSENRRHRASGSANWTSREDKNCGDYDSDGLSGFDSYEDNDFLHNLHYNLRRNLRHAKTFFKKIHPCGIVSKYCTFRVLYIPFYPPNAPIFCTKAPKKVQISNKTHQKKCIFLHE